MWTGGTLRFRGFGLCDPSPRLAKVLAEITSEAKCHDENDKREQDLRSFDLDCIHD